VSRIDYEAALDCVHCGLCLPVCPTYQETGSEVSSPRGRIYTMRGIAEGRIELDRDVADDMFLCLACRACESACPAGVRYGHLVETMRAEIVAAGPRARLARWLERFVLRRVVGSPRMLRWVGSLLRAYQRSGFEGVVARSGMLRFMPPLSRAAANLPTLSDRFRPPVLIPARGTRRGRVAFFSGCVMSEMFGQIHEATVRVLAENGFEVEVPPDQVCCGALHAHAGDLDTAERLAKRNRSAFQVERFDAVIVNSAGCGAAMRDRGDALAAVTRDVSEFLVERGLRPPTHHLYATVAYADPCHLLHGQKVAEQPRALLRAIPGLEVVDLPGAGECCGAAGTYALTHPEMSDRLLQRKLDGLRKLAPDYVAAGNPGCLLQLRRGIVTSRLEVETVHPIELLDRAYLGDQRRGT